MDVACKTSVQDAISTATHIGLQVVHFPQHKALETAVSKVTSGSTASDVPSVGPRRNSIPVSRPGPRGHSGSSPHKTSAIANRPSLGDGPGRLATSLVTPSFRLVATKQSHCTQETSCQNRHCLFHGLVSFGSCWPATLCSRRLPHTRATRMPGHRQTNNPLRSLTNYFRRSISALPSPLHPADSAPIDLWILHNKDKRNQHVVIHLTHFALAVRWLTHSRQFPCKRPSR